MFKLAYYITFTHLRVLSEQETIATLIEKGFKKEDIAMGISLYRMAMEHEQKEKILDYLDMHSAILQTAMDEGMEKGMRMLGDALDGIQDILFPNLWDDIHDQFDLIDGR